MEMIDLLWYTSIPALSLTSFILVNIVGHNMAWGARVFTPQAWVYPLWVVSLGIFVGGFFV